MDELIEKFKKFEKFRLIISVFSFGGCLPLLLSIFVIFVAALFLLGLIGTPDDVANEEECTPVKSADMICQSITVNGKTMDVDEYVAGVVMAEVGGFNNLESEKAVAVAARSYALNTAKKDDSGNCDMGSAGPSSQAYSDSPNSMATQAANDTSGMILVDDSGKVGFTQYDAFAWTEEKGGYFYLRQGGNEEKNQKVPSDWVHSHYSDSQLSFYKTSQHGNGLSQVGSLYLATEKGYDYKKILDFYYGDDGYSLATTGSGDITEICTGGNLQTLDHYTLNHEGLNILDHPLSASEIADLNSYLENEVKKAGHGSGAAVAAAGQGLIYWLETQKQAYLSYYWAGGHGGFGDDSTVIGGDDDWGSTRFGVDTHNGNHRPYFGMDCSGFVSWATRMGCNPGFGSNVSGGWNNLGTGLSSLSQTEPGDVITNDNHIMLVVKNNGDGSVIIAEETGSKGLVFTQRNSASGYYIRSMKSWYASNCTDIQPPSNVDSNGGGSSGSSSNDDLGKQIQSYISSHNAGGSWAVYVKNLKTGKTSTYNASASMKSASVMKLFIAGAVYEKINRGGSGLTEQGVAGNMQIMIRNSDNAAANSLKNSAGGYSAINSYASRHGYNGVSMNRDFLKSGPENVLTARAVGKFLEDLQNGRVVNSHYSGIILDHMKHQVTKYKIPAGVPSGVTVANKTGELSDVANDAAIVYSSGGTYVLVVLSQGVNTSIANSTVTGISRLVYDYYN